jgi:hypothetical protein
MKLRLAFLLFIYFCSYANARIIGSAKIDYSNIDFLGKSDSVFWIAQDNGNTFGFNHKVCVASYDFNLNQKSSVILKLFPENDHFIFLKSNILITDEDVQYSNKIFSIRNIIFSNGKINEKKIEVFNINGWKEHFKLESESYDFFTRVSISGNKVLFVYRNNYKDEYANEIKIRILYSIDSLSEIRTLKIPYSYSKSKISNFVFDDSDGEKLFVLVTLFDTISLKRKKVSKTELMEYDLNTFESKINNLPFTSNYSSSKLLRVNGKTIIGLLTANEELSFLTGYRFILHGEKTDVDGSLDFIDSLSIKKNLLGAHDSYSLREMHLFKDAKIISILEKNYSTEGVSSSAPMTTIGPGGSMQMGGGGASVFSAGDIYVSEYNLYNKTGFTYKIEKQQSFESPLFISYLLLTNDQSANLVFNKKDLDRSSLFSPAYKISNYRVTDSIKEDTGIIFPDPEFNSCRLQTKSFIKLSDTAYIVAATLRKKNTYLIKLNLPD